MKKCPSCGARNDDEAVTCTLCAVAFAKAVTARQGLSGSGPIVEPRLWQLGRPRTTREQGGKEPEAGPRGERHFLVPPMGDPLELQATPRALVLGRDDDCDVRIASPTISRHHAEIDFRGVPPRAFLRDLGTKNGSRVNKEKLKGERELKDRDLLRLGDVTAVYRLLEPGVDPHTLATSGDPATGSETIAMAAPGEAEGAGADSLVGLKGDLSFLSVQDLLGRFARLGATGTLVIEVDGVKGRIELASGSAQDARFGGRAGPGAIQLLSELKRGHFRFEPKGATAPGAARPTAPGRPAGSPPAAAPPRRADAGPYAQKPKLRPPRP